MILSREKNRLIHLSLSHGHNAKLRLPFCCDGDWTIVRRKAWVRRTLETGSYGKTNDSMGRKRVNMVKMGSVQPYAAINMDGIKKNCGSCDLKVT